MPLRSILVGKLKTSLDATGLSLGLLFPGRNGKLHSRSFIYWAITRLAAKYGVHGKVGAHSCRHSHITNQHKAGSTLAEIQANVGHTLLATTEGYIHESGEGRVEAQDRLARLAGLE